MTETELIYQGWATWTMPADAMRWQGDDLVVSTANAPDWIETWNAIARHYRETTGKSVFDA